MTAAQHATPQRSPWWTVAVVFTLATGAFAYGGVITGGLFDWLHSPDDQHRVLVLPVTLALLYWRRDTLPWPTWQVDLRGLALIAIAAGMRVYAQLQFRPWMEFLSIPVWVAGVAMLFGGWKLLRWAAPPIAFLVFAAPLPGQIQTAAGLPLQSVSANISVWILQLLGQPAFAAGTTVLLGRNVLEVDQACAGLRMFEGMLAVAAGWSLFRRYDWRRFLVTLAVAPLIAILVNACRIALIGIFYEQFSDETGRTLAHDLSGVLTIPVGVFVFFLLDELTNRGSRLARERPERAATVAAMAAVGLVVLGTAANSIHRYQERKAIGLVLEQARHHATDGTSDNLARADELYRRYLSVRGNTPEILSELADVNEQIGAPRWERAATLYEMAWSLDPSRGADALSGIALVERLEDWQQLWERTQAMVSQLSGLDRVAVLRARTRAVEKLLKASTATPDVEEMFAACLQGVKEDEEHFDHMWQLARLTRMFPDHRPIDGGAPYEHRQSSARVPAENRTGRSTELDACLDKGNRLALDVVDNCISAHSGEPYPLLCRALLLESAAKSASDFAVRDLLESESAKTLAEALRIVSSVPPADDSVSPKSGRRAATNPTVQQTTAAAVFHLAAEQAMRHGKAKESRQFITRCLALSPGDAKIYLALSNTYARSAVAARIAILETALARFGPSELFITLPLAEAYLAAGRDADAAELLSPIEESVPRLSAKPRAEITLMLALARASGLVQQQREREAAKLLSRALESDSVLSQSGQLASLYANAQMELGGIYRSIGLDAAAASAFREGGRFDSDSPAWNLHAAMAYEATENYQAALTHYRRAAPKMDQRRPDLYLAMARTMLSIARGQAKTNRNDASIRSMIQSASDRGGDPAQIAALTAEMHVIDGDRESARRVIEDEIGRAPEALELHWIRASLLQASGDTEAAIGAADRYRDVGGNESDALALKVMVLQRANRIEEADTAIRSARKDDPSLTLKRARMQLIDGLLRSGRLEEAADRVRSLAEDFSGDIRIQSAAADVLGDMGLEHELQVVEDRLRQIEGESGTLWRASRAERLLRQAVNAQQIHDAEQLAKEASQLIDRLRQSRPEWPTTMILFGQREEYYGRWSEALVAYQAAWSSGNRDALTAAHVLRMMNRLGMGAELDLFLNQIDDLVPQSTVLFDRAMPQYVRHDRGKYALNLARLWLQKVDSPENAIRFAQTLIAVARRDGASEGIRQDVQFARRQLEEKITDHPQNVEAWVAAFHLEVFAASDRAAALDKITSLSDDLQIDPLAKSFLLAQLFRNLGEDARAGRSYEESIRRLDQARAVDRRRILVSAVTFFSSRRPDKALVIGRQLQSEFPEFSVTKRLLIDLLAEQSSWSALQEAIRIADSTSSDTFHSQREAARMQASLRIARIRLGGQMMLGRKSATTSPTSPSTIAATIQTDHREAARLLESIHPRTAEDIAATAWLAMQRGEHARAFSLMRESLRLDLATPKRLSQTIDAWIHAYAAEGLYHPIADELFARLAVFPGARSDWLHRSLDRIDAETSVEERSSAGKSPVREQELLERYALEFLSDPESESFAQHVSELLEGLDDAGRLDLVGPALDRLPPPGAVVAASEIAAAMILHRERIELTHAIASELRARIDRSSPLSHRACIDLGDAFFVCGDSTSAESFYRRAIAQAPDAVDALNNLAIVLADNDSYDEALETIDRVIEIEPDNPLRHDTRLVVLLLANRFDQAASVSSSLAERFDALVLMHRAFAAMKRRDLTEAVHLLNQARDAGVAGRLVAPSDQRMYDELMDTLRPSTMLSDLPGNRTPTIRSPGGADASRHIVERKVAFSPARRTKLTPSRRQSD